MSSQHSEFRAAIQVLQDAYDHGHPDDLEKCPWAFETLDGLVEQLGAAHDEINERSDSQALMLGKLKELQEQLEATQRDLEETERAREEDGRRHDEQLEAVRGALREIEAQPMTSATHNILIDLREALGEAEVPASSVIPSPAARAGDLPQPAVLYFEDMPVTLTEPGLYEVRSRDWPEPNPAKERP